MKQVIIILLLGLVTHSLYGQTFSEWFQQKETQREYLVQQIAVLQVYIGYIEKGYQIAREGLTAISDFKSGELNLHKGYFHSLKNVNPLVKDNTRVAGVIALQLAIVKRCRKTFEQAKDNGSFTQDEISYIYGVLGRLLDECATVTDNLIRITTPGEFEMKDDERLKCINKLYDNMQDNYTFSQSFSNEVSLLASERTGEMQDIRVKRLLGGIKKDEK